MTGSVLGAALKPRNKQKAAGGRQRALTFIKLGGGKGINGLFSVLAPGCATCLQVTLGTSLVPRKPSSLPVPAAVPLL